MARTRRRVTALRALAPPALRPLLLPLVVAGLGCLIGQWLTIDASSGSSSYAYLTYGLLAVGLYGSAYGISRPEKRADVYRIVIAITFGVAAKAAIVAGVLLLVFHDRPQYLVLAVAMAQIDPLSVSALLDDRDMSPRAKSLLAAWASFDDPVTTVLVVYAGALVVKGADSAAGGTVAYASTLALNAALVAVAAALWWLLARARRGPGVRPGPGAEGLAGHGSAGPAPGRRVAAQNALLLAVAAVAVWQFLMLGLAATALFLRPPLDRWIRRATGAALYLATFLLGLLLARGVHPLAGLVLGCATFAAQTVVGAAVTWGLPRRDRWALCLSQQNGITAIILALLLQPLLPEAIGIVAPAILVVNVLHLASTSVLGAVLGRTPPDRPGDGHDGRDGEDGGRDEPGAAGGPHSGSRLSAPA